MIIWSTVSLTPQAKAEKLQNKPWPNSKHYQNICEQQHGFEIEADAAYPVAVIVNNRGEARRPSRADLLWYEAGFRAIPLLVRDHLNSNGRGDYQPLDVTLSVAAHAGDVLMRAKYPAGDLHLLKQPPARTDWSERAVNEDTLLSIDVGWKACWRSWRAE